MPDPAAGSAGPSDPGPPDGGGRADGPWPVRGAAIASSNASSNGSSSHGTASSVTTWRLETEPAARLIAEVTALEDLHTVLQCCERLITDVVLAPPRPPGLNAVVESLWRTSVLAYQRCFVGPEPALAEQDVLDTHPDHPEVAQWHRALIGLLLPEPGPAGQTCAVGVVREESGAPLGIAVTAADLALPDEVIVRAAGALAYALSTVLDARLDEHQASLFEQVSAMSPAELDRLPRVETTTGA